MTRRIIKHLGSGGFGIVDLVEDRSGNRFACKSFQINQPLQESLIENVKKRFIREAKIQKGISHKNIVPIIEDHLDNDPPHYLMPVASGSLADDLEQDKTLGGNYVSALIDIIDGLEELHTMGMCHRDLKPQNVLRFTEKNADGTESSYYAIGDFGFISLKDSRLSKLSSTGMKRGSDFYTAKEVTVDLRNATPQSDIYSLGCIIHDMVGQRQREICDEIREDGEFGALLLNCTRREPKRRFKNVGAIRDILLSMDVSSVDIQDARAENIIQYLESAEDLSASQCKALIEFLDDKAGSNDAKAVLQKLHQDKIEGICANFPDEARKLGIIYARWIHGNSFDFGLCDALANRLQVFVERCPFDVKAECLLAMLELGTSHNRWYVERKFVALCGPSMDPALARRLSVEFRALDTDICRTMGHLEWSIGTSRDALHPILARTLGEMCPPP